MFSGSRPFMPSDLSLLIQISAFLFLIHAVYRRKKSIASHGKIASVAFCLALPAVFYMLYNRQEALHYPITTGF
ncbi:hypothetical protein MSHOH_1896 [Methanosarcina horonobensis HB-1 = JCM 15518]|uniref:Uncharacterized protein n=1 Tax=Methanosarcina horonobensis HB-1 = JCM 15518 TaxID=1434110 RepID=A0A0E3S9U0_9EURY|nr:hypothetical protein MSHOH_1896 [Methanosarcina horonobensis HB-1 = JCM 15518]